jgi:hypothetical protein
MGSAARTPEQRLVSTLSSPSPSLRHRARLIAAGAADHLFEGFNEAVSRGGNLGFEQGGLNSAKMLV